MAHTHPRPRLLLRQYQLQPNRRHATRSQYRIPLQTVTTAQRSHLRRCRQYLAITPQPNLCRRRLPMGPFLQRDSHRLRLRSKVRLQLLHRTTRLRGAPQRPTTQRKRPLGHPTFIRHQLVQQLRKSPRNSVFVF